MKNVNRNLVIIPTRGRASAIKDRIIENASLSSCSDFVLAIDLDDAGDYEWAASAGVFVSRGKSNGMNAALNRAAMERADEYDYVSFMGDDSAVRTPGWDSIFVEALGSTCGGVAYGNDLLSHGLLPTFVMVSTNIVKPLGYFAPPILRHMFLDDFWLLLGHTLGRCHYDQNVIVEHMHHSAGKSDLDETYRATNRHLVNIRDRLNFFIYKKTQFPSAIRRVQRSDKGN